MSSHKIKQYTIPPFVGLLIAFTLLFAFQNLTTSLYGSNDADDVFGDDFFIIGLLIGFLPMLVIAAAFQYFVGLPVWEKYKNGSKLFNLHLWQLVVVSSIIFSVIFFLLFYNENTISFTNPLLALSASIIITLLYWAGNIFTLKRLGKVKNKKFS